MRCSNGSTRGNVSGVAGAGGSWRENVKKSRHKAKTRLVFENEKKLLEPNDCHFLYTNLVEELPNEVP